MSKWTDEQKQEIVKMYLDGEPTPTNSMEIVADVAEHFGETPNAIRMLLSREEVYVKKDPAKKATTSTSGDKPARVGKEAAQQQLIETIQGLNKTVDEDIISKLTGKAAVYITQLLSE